MGRHLLWKQTVMKKISKHHCALLLTFAFSILFAETIKSEPEPITSETVNNDTITCETVNNETLTMDSLEIEISQSDSEKTESDTINEIEINLQNENNTQSETEESKTSGNPEKSAQFPLIEAYKDRSEVEAWRQYYLSSEKRIKLLYDILENAMEYRLFVRKTVIDREVPGELEYLPVVESGYKTSAKSRSGALGMWQFMENSVKPFLTLNEYVDERLDPWKSTEGGLSKLQDNYRYFNDWLLAIGAYNCGSGAMNKAIKKGETRDFWTLSEKGVLSAQTRDYVPKLIAIADLAINHEEYQIDIPEHSEEFAVLTNERDGLFDYVTVQKNYSISAIARDMRMEEKQLRKLNPALTKGFTPPATKYNIRVPVGMKKTCEDVISQLQPIEFPFQYKVCAGDSLWSISRKFGTTVQAICDTNGIEENAILRIGKILYIPGK